MTNHELAPEQLRTYLDPETLDFQSIERVEHLKGIIGQKRAVSALRSGLQIGGRGFNIYVAGSPGTGRMASVQSSLEEFASSKETPPDWWFEQSYEGIEGDSASSAELHAILSALCGVPIKQSIAVTGSVNQHGQVKAVGGINQKIEGFYDICKLRGRSGDQGVIVPKSHEQNLVLRRDVVDAVASGKFHVWAVGSIDEGMELLTSTQMGEQGVDGEYPEGCINDRIHGRLVDFEQTLRELRDSGDSRGAAAHGRGRSSNL